MKRSPSTTSRPYTSPYERTANVIFLLLSAPRTVREIIHLCGMPELTAKGRRNSTSHTTISRCLKSLQAEGIVEIVGSRQPPPGQQGCRSAIWAWAVLPSRYTLSEDESL